MTGSATGITSITCQECCCMLTGSQGLTIRSEIRVLDAPCLSTYICLLPGSYPLFAPKVRPQVWAIWILSTFLCPQLQASCELHKGSGTSNVPLIFLSNQFLCKQRTFQQQLVFILVNYSTIIITEIKP